MKTVTILERSPSASTWKRKPLSTYRLIEYAPVLLAVAVTGSPVSQSVATWRSFQMYADS